MTKTQIQRLIENLRVQSAANSISPDMLATILTCLNDAPATVNNTYIEAPPLLYCEVVGGKLYLRNFAYYKDLGLKPILFRYIRKHNRYRLRRMNKHSPMKKGWFANGLQGTLRLNKDGQVLRSEKVINDFDHTHFTYKENAAAFINDARYNTGEVSWGCESIGTKVNETHRMIRLPFAIGFAKDNRLQNKGIKLSDLQSNLAPFFVRGQLSGGNKMYWAFSR